MFFRIKTINKCIIGTVVFEFNWYKQTNIQKILHINYDAVMRYKIPAFAKLFKYVLNVPSSFFLFFSIRIPAPFKEYINSLTVRRLVKVEKRLKCNISASEFVIVVFSFEGKGTLNLCIWHSLLHG